MVTFEGGYTDKGSVPNLQGHSSAFSIIVAFMPLGLFWLKGPCFFMSSLGPFSQLLDKFSSNWLCDGMWSQTKCHINWKARLSTKHEIVGAEPCG